MQVKNSAKVNEEDSAGFMAQVPSAPAFLFSESFEIVRICMTSHNACDCAAQGGECPPQAAARRVGRAPTAYLRVPARPLHCLYSLRNGQLVVVVACTRFALAPISAHSRSRYLADTFAPKASPAVRHWYDCSTPHTKHHRVPHRMGYWSAYSSDCNTFVHFGPRSKCGARASRYRSTSARPLSKPSWRKSSRCAVATPGHPQGRVRAACGFAWFALNEKRFPQWFQNQWHS